MEVPMRQFTQDELSEKINQFITKKRIQYPEATSLKEVKVKQPKRPMRESFRITVNFVPTRAIQTV
jgi:hypothetical protein